MQYGIVVSPADYARVQQSGYNYLELAGRAVAAMDDAAFEALRAQVSLGSIPCLGLNAYCPPQVVVAGENFDPDVARAYAQRLAPRAEALGVRVVVIGSPFSRRLPQGFDRALAWRQAARFFRETARVFAPYGITVCVEALGPCYCNFINRLDEACRMVREISEQNLKIVLDFYNMEHSGEADVSLTGYAQEIGHAHISDDAGDPRQRSYLKAEKYALHARRLRALRAAGYSGRVSLEIDVPYNMREAAQSLDMLRGME